MKQNNIHKNTCCLICNGKKNHYDFSIDKFRVEECTNCGMMRLNPQPTDRDLADVLHENNFLAAQNSNDSQLHTSMLKSSTADHYLNALESYIGTPLGGCLLVVGRGISEFPAKAVSRGLSVSEVEFSTENVIYNEISLLLKAEKRFNYIVIADVLEHMRNPRQLLKHVHGLLQENGVVMTIVPAIDSFTARVMRNKWVGFKPDKLWYFSKPTLRQLLYTEHFGELKALQAKKTLSVDYISERFTRYPAQPYSTVCQILKQILPVSLRQYPVHINASSIMMIAKKAEIKPIKKLSVIMAVFNEEKTVRRTIEQVLEKSLDHIELELIIVESKSSDNTREVLREYENNDRIKMIWQEQPRGKGNAIRAGLEQVSGDIILIQDADDEYDFDDYDALIEPLLTGEAAFVLGARHGGSAWKMRQFSDQRLAGHVLNLGHWFFALLVNVFFKLRLKDPFTMFKVFRADCLQGLTFECNRFDFDFELLIKLVRNGYKPIEIPVNYRSRSFKEGKKVNVIRDPLTWLRAIVKFRLQKM